MSEELKRPERLMKAGKALTEVEELQNQIDI